MPKLNLDVLARAIDAEGQAIAITDPEPRILAVNRHYTEVTGHEASEIVGKNPSFLNDGSTQFYMPVFCDITPLILTESQLGDPACFNPLTGLVNRRMFEDRLVQAIGMAKREVQCGALVLIGLDGFKRINDIYGDDAGDRVLLTIAARMVGSMGDNGTVARLGGDEFAVLCPEIADRDSCEVFVRRLAQLIRELIRLVTGECVDVGASIGISLFPNDARHPKRVMQAADRAICAVKGAGKNGFCFAGDDMVQLGITPENCEYRPMA